LQVRLGLYFDFVCFFRFSTLSVVSLDHFVRTLLAFVVGLIFFGTKPRDGWKELSSEWLILSWMGLEPQLSPFHALMLLAWL